MATVLQFYCAEQNYCICAEDYTACVCPVCPSAAPVASALSARCSHRSVVIMGGLICSLGVVIGAFARNLIELYLTVGFLNGEQFDANTHIKHKPKNTHIQNM